MRTRENILVKATRDEKGQLWLLEGFESNTDDVFVN